MSNLTFRLLMYAAGVILTSIGLAMFLRGWGAEALVLMLGSGAVLGYIVGVREMAERDAEEREAGAPEGAHPTVRMPRFR